VYSGFIGFAECEYFYMRREERSLEKKLLGLKKDGGSEKGRWV